LAPGLGFKATGGFSMRSVQPMNTATIGPSAGTDDAIRVIRSRR
jgi:hypothetical protein